MDGSLVADDQDNTETAILKFIQQSTVLQKRFSDKCMKVLNLRKKTAKDAYFGILGYNYSLCP